MPTLPTSIADLSTTAALNYPAGTDSPSTLDDVQRAHASYIALVRNLVGYGTGTYVPATAITNMGLTPLAIGAATLASPTFTGTVALPVVTISGAVTGASTAKFDDITTYRALATNTGYYYCGNTNTKYMGFDGTNFVFSSPIVITSGSIATTQAVNNSSTLVATTAFANPASSLSANGYVKLPSGIIIQWGTATSGAGGGFTVSFPVTFPTGVMSMTANVISGGPSAALVIVANSGTTSSNCWVTQSATGAGIVGVNVAWMAIGY